MASNGNGARTRRQVKRLREKAARKAAMKALYEGFRDSGRNSKRSGLRESRAVGVRKVDHPNGRCGNIGCRKCNEEFNRLHPPGNRMVKS